MTFGLGGAAIGGIIGGIGQGAASLFGGGAAKGASQAQQNASIMGMIIQAQQFAAMQKLLEPYTKAGEKGIGGQLDLLGLNGNDAQANAIQLLKSGSQFDALNKQGQDAILANASATGGLRGGNTQGALAQFSPALLQSLIESQYGKLGGLSSLGESAAAGVGNAGMQYAQNMTNSLNQFGQAQAGGILAGGAAQQGLINSFAGGLGLYKGLGGKF